MTVPVVVPDGTMPVVAVDFETGATTVTGLGVTVVNIPVGVGIAGRNGELVMADLDPPVDLTVLFDNTVT